MELENAYENERRKRVENEWTTQKTQTIIIIIQIAIMTTQT